MVGAEVDMGNVITFLSRLSTAAKATAADLRAVSSAAAAAASATAGITGGAGGGGGMTHGPGVKTTVHAVGPGLPADVIGALRSLGGR